MTDPTARIYMDNAATSFPKPPQVLQAMTHYATELGASPGRGAYAESRESGRLLDECRARICQLINATEPSHLIFTLNCSDSLNIAIKGIVRPGDHVITTELDHNSILRPYNAMVQQGIVSQTRLPCDPVTGLVDPEQIRQAIQPNTRLVAMLHASNVTGTLQDIQPIGQMLQSHDKIIFLVDAAQSLGHVPIDVQRMGIDLLAAPGHKGLLGPLGTGILYIRPGLEQQMNTIREGGTGSVSELDTQPQFMPDKFESGSHNTIGLIGLSQGVQWVLDQGVDKLWAHEQALIHAMIQRLSQTEALPGLELYGPPTAERRVGVFSFRIKTPDDRFADPKALADLLESEFGLLSRPGLHCAPGAHATVGSYDLGGTTRLSLGPDNSLEQIHYAADALQSICQRYASIPVSANADS